MSKKIQAAKATAASYQRAIVLPAITGLWLMSALAIALNA